MSRSSVSLEDGITFLDEAASSGQPVTASSAYRRSWRVLIVDDDRDVHTATTYALASLEMQQRPLEFLHAFSAHEARELLMQERDIAVILLDVVMEAEDSGLRLVRHIRENLQLTEVRIILRTGQPGYAPELEAIRDYDINDYKTKSELTRIKLYTAVTAALRSYEQIRAINASRNGLDRIVQASSELMALHDLDRYTEGILVQARRLLDWDLSGLVCVQEYPDPEGPIIVAATGKHTGLRGARLQAAGLADLAAVRQALEHQENVFGETSAVLYLLGNSARSYCVLLDSPLVLDELEKQLLSVFGRHVTVGLDNVLLLSRLHNYAFYDPLTRLPNRTRLVELIWDALDSSAGREATLALVDIDHFSETNDALGHQFGDLLLLGVASRLSARFGDKLAVSRVGSDTFGVLGPPGLVNPSLLLALFEEPFDIEGQKIQLTATAGLVRLSEYEGTASDVLKDADIALKRAKLLQRSGYFYFSRSMGVDVRERVQMMHALRSARDANELFVVYQPQIELASRRPVGAEALLRWKTTSGGFISPDRFIPIAEYSGLIIDIGERVLREACSELVRLQEAGFPHFTISVNVSQVQFRHSHFLEMLRDVLAQTSVRPDRVELELTESIAMEEPDRLIELLGQVKDTGVTIAIDDFGTGFSSLSYLQRLQADRLKIDRSFVTEITGSMRGSRIAEMVIQLGRNLGISVVAEGVEDECQARILSTLGCPFAQGYLFARPMPMPQLTDWLKEHASR